MIGPFTAHQHANPPVGEAAGCLVMRWPRIAALAQALVSDQCVHFVITQNCNAVRRPCEPALRSGFENLFRANGERRVGHIEIWRGFKRGGELEDISAPSFIWTRALPALAPPSVRQVRPVPSPCMGLVFRSGSQYGINLKYGFRSFKGKILSAPPQMPFCYGMSSWLLMWSWKALAACWLNVLLTGI